MERTWHDDVNDHLNELSRDVAALHLYVEEQRWWRWGTGIGVALILWRVW